MARLQLFRTLGLAALALLSSTATGTCAWSGWVGFPLHCFALRWSLKILLFYIVRFSPCHFRPPAVTHPGLHPYA